MPIPNDAPSLPHGVELNVTPLGQCAPSAALVDLLVTARSQYDWPQGTGAAASQQVILTLEHTVAGLLTHLSHSSAKNIVVAVSDWAGNNANSHSRIVNANAAAQQVMAQALVDLGTAGRERAAFAALCGLDGISLVIASKIYRFCEPTVGAAVDRHASYFFNSLRSHQGVPATTFRREWANGRRAGSRLVYSNSRVHHNRIHYFDRYLPLLIRVANALNALARPYTCAVRGTPQAWRPADVEMAAYFWWACHGAR
jgi:hypothetical protein